MTTIGRAYRPPAPSPRGRSALGALDGPLELGLAHLGPAGDVQPAGLGLELLAGRLLAAADLVGLHAERRARLAREVLQRLLALGAGLRLLDVAPRGRALLLSGHGIGLPGPWAMATAGAGEGSPHLPGTGRICQQPRAGDDAGSQEESCD